MPLPLVPLAIAGGSYLLDRFSKKPSSTTSSTGLDPTTDFYRKQQYAAAAGAAGSPTEGDFRAWLDAQSKKGIKYGDDKALALGQQRFMQEWNSQPHAGGSITGTDPYTKQALDTYGQYSNLGLGAGKALGGDQAEIAKLMNPYESSVISALDPIYAKARQSALGDVNARFSSAGGGAFGGSRQGVASGVALGDIANQQASQTAGLRYQGYNDAMTRAYQTANLGLGATDRLPGLGQYAQGMDDPNLRRLMLLQRANGQPKRSR